MTTLVIPNLFDRFKNIPSQSGSFISTRDFKTTMAGSHFIEGFGNS